jgi:hypothetical protein
MSYFRGAEYNALKQTHGGSWRGRKPSGQSDHLKKTGEEVAGKYGVSEKTVRRDGVFAQVIDRIVEDYGDPEVRRNLLGADVRLTQGTARVLLKMPAGERKRVVDELVEKGELPRARKGRTAGGRKPREVAQSLVARLNKKGEGQAEAVFKQMARILGFEVTEKSAEK